MRAAGLAANPTTQTSPAGREHEEGEFGGPLWWLWRVRRWRALRWPRCALRWLRRALRPLRPGGHVEEGHVEDVEEGHVEHGHVEDGAAQAQGARARACVRCG